MSSDTQSELRRRVYRDPPVVEGIARLHWDEPVKWGPTTPGLLYEQLRDDYPEEPKAQNLMEADFRQGGGDSNFQIRSGPVRMAYQADSGTRLLMVSPTDLSVHGLPPYEGWESLEARLTRGFEKANAVLGIDAKFSQLGLRYINRVEIAEPAIRFVDYFTIGFYLPPAFPQSIESFLDRVEAEYPDEPIRLAFTWASTEAPEGSSAFILDFDLTADLPEPLGLTDSISLLNEMKTRETLAFEALLQDRLREQFGEIAGK